MYSVAAAGHHQYAKGARLYVQLMQQRQDSPAFQETLSKFTVYGNHAVRFSDHEWSGTWTDITIETTLMCEAKSSGGLTEDAYGMNLLISLGCRLLTTRSWKARTNVGNLSIQMSQEPKCKKTMMLSTPWLDGWKK